MKHATDADQDTLRASVFHEGDLFGVEETQRLLRFEMAGEAVEQSRLVRMILNPLRVEAQVGFPLGLDVYAVLFAEGFHRLV